MLASEVTPEMMKADHIIYIGYLSGLDMLQNVVFAGSRYSIGDSYDEIIDNKTEKKYFSQANYFGSRGAEPAATTAMPRPSSAPPAIASSSSPERGTWPSGRSPRNDGSRVPAELAKRTSNAKAYEALYVVEAMKQTQYGGAAAAGLAARFRQDLERAGAAAISGQVIVIRRGRTSPETDSGYPI